jgi:hypothetical protein
MMDAFNSGRHMTAVVASGVVLGLTALTAGIAPASANPGADAVTPSTTAVAEPVVPRPAEPVQGDDSVWQSPPAQQRSGPKEPPAVETPSTDAGVGASTPRHTRSAPAEPTAETSAPETAAATVRAEPTATTVSAAPAEPVAEPATPVSAAPAEPSAAEPTATTEPAKPVTAAPSAGPAATAAPNTTIAPTTTIVPVPPAPVSADTSSHTPTAPSAGVQDAAAPGVLDQRRGAPNWLAPRSGADSTDDGASPAGRPREGGQTTPPSMAVTEPAREVLTPQTLQAPEADVTLAKSVRPIERKPDPAPLNEVAELAKAIDIAPPIGGPAGLANTDGARVVRANAIAWDRNVRQWSPEWVRYDKYYRPVIANPYRDPVRIVYVYQNAPRMVMIPPLQSVVMDVAQLAAYSFTAVVVNAVNSAVNVAVGSFFGGGYLPAVGMPVPPVPRPVLRYDNVPIQVRYASATYEPFVVRQVVDAGDDPQYGGHKLLLDGVTPVWGQWVQNPSGQRQFEVYKTQQFPGLDTPAEAPLPGDYRLRLAAETTGTGSSDTNKYLAIAAVTAAGLSLGLVGLSIFLGRRRPQY